MDTKAHALDQVAIIEPMDVEPIKSEEVKLYTVQEMMLQAKERAFSSAPKRLCTTGMHELDDATGGIQPGFSWVLGADSNWGKSSFLIMVADENLKRGRGVLIVSAEDTPELFGRRMLARRSGVNAKRLRDRQLDANEKQSVVDTVTRAEKKPAFLDATDMTAEQVAANVRKILAEQDIDLVMYDYLQEFRSGERQQDRRNEVSNVMKMLRGPVRAAGRISIMASQITVSMHKKVPDKHSIKESRDVVNAAEVVVLGYFHADEKAAEDEKRKWGDPRGERRLFVDKVKDGRAGFALKMAWDRTSANFACLDEYRLTYGIGSRPGVAMPPIEDM